MTTGPVNMKAVRDAVETFDNLASTFQANRQTHHQLAQHIATLQRAADRLKELESIAAISESPRPAPPSPKLLKKITKLERSGAMGSDEVALPVKYADASDEGANA